MCDAEHLTASTIISEIEMAFKAWKGNVYTQNCSFHDFVNISCHIEERTGW